jgi:hypothetical protein
MPEAQSFTLDVQVTVPPLEVEGEKPETQVMCGVEVGAGV